MVTTRLASPSDAPVIHDLIQLYVPSGELLPRSVEFVSLRAHEFVVAESHGRVVGCAHLDEYAPSLAELRSLAVAPEAQGRGVGVALVAAIEQLAARRGFATLFAVSNSAAFFAKRGYEERDVPELNRERSEVSRWKTVHAKQIGAGIATS
jgi:amino-acid N-acetyltransferase